MLTSNVGGEEEILSAALLDDLVQSRLIDRELVRVPRSDPRCVDVDDSDLV